MPDDCDPSVLHARVCVLESDNKRHEADICQLFGDVSALKVCASSLPGIERTLDKMQLKIETLQLISKEQAVKMGIVFLAVNAIITATVAYMIGRV